MAALFVDSMMHYDTNNIDRKWNQVSDLTSSGCRIVTPSTGVDLPREGVNAMELRSIVAHLVKTMKVFSSRFIIGFRALFDEVGLQLYSGNVCLFSLINGATSQIECSVYLSITGQLSVTDGLNGSAIATSSWACKAGRPAYLEFDITLGDGVVLRKDGVVGATATGLSGFGVTGTASAIKFGSPHGSTVGCPVKFCDLYIFDPSGDYNNAMVGDVRVDCLYPIEDVQDDFTPSTGSDHWALVDEPTAPNFTDYTDGFAVGDRDSFLYEPIPPLDYSTIFGVQVTALVHKTDAGGKNMAVFAHHVATTEDGPTDPINITAEYIHHVFETDPDGGLWSEADVNAADFGVVVTE